MSDDKKPSIWEKIGLISPDDTPAAPVAAAPTAAPVASIPAPTPWPQAGFPVAPVAVIDGAQKDKYRVNLEKAMSEEDIPGPDFLEFRNGFRSMKSAMVGAPESTVFQGALAMMTGQGVKVDYLAQTADHYLNVLEKCQHEFEAHTQENLKAKVADRMAAADKIQAAIQDKQNLVAKLTQEIGELGQQEVQVRQEAAQSQAEITAKVQVFLQAKTEAAQEIAGIKQTLSAYLVPTTPAPTK